MNIKFSTLLNSISSFQELQQIKFPPRVSLDLYKLGKELETELGAYKDLSKKIYTEHDIPETSEGFNLKGVSQENLKKLFVDLEELLNTEIEIKDFTLNMDVFEKSNVDISTEMLVNLQWLIRLEEV